MSRWRLGYLETVKCNLSQGDQPRLLTRNQYLVEIERQAEVPKRRRVIRAQTNWNTMIQHRRDRVHRYRGGITLENRAVETIRAVSRRLNNDGMSYQYLVPTNIRCSVELVECEQANEMTNEIGQTSKAIFCSLHISMSLGCLIIENLHPQRQNEIRSTT